MKLIKACFLSYVSLLQGFHAKEGVLLLAALDAWHEALILVPTCPLSTNVHFRKVSDAVREERPFHWQLETSGSLAFGTATWQVSLLCISCWMIGRVFWEVISHSLSPSYTPRSLEAHHAPLNKFWPSGHFTKDL